MQITNNLNCCKPRRRLNFKGREESPCENRKVRYKHFKQMDDNVLGAHSVAKAYKSVEKSGKMRLYKAIPTIAATVIGTGLALSQPGKLSAKAAKGLGFLVLAKSAGEIAQSVNETIEDNYIPKDKNEAKNTFKKSAIKIAACVASCAVCAGGAILALKGGKQILSKAAPKALKFLESEKNVLTSEINNSKAGKFVEKTLNPFISKHENKFNIASDVLPFAAVAGGIVAQNKLSKSLSKDIVQKAQLNFVKGKMIQQMAREKFDAIDAQEIQ